MRAGTRYVIQRQRRNGRVYEIRGQPMPDGGYVTTYTDITEFKHTEQQLLEAKQTLEQRVTERTLELSKALAAEARGQARGRAGQFDQDALRRRGEPRPAAAAERGAAVRLRARATRPTTGTVREIAGRIEGSLRAAEEVLDDMLDIARLESGVDAQPRLTVFALDDVFADLERQFSPVAAQAQPAACASAARGCTCAAIACCCGACCRTWSPTPCATRSAAASSSAAGRAAVASRCRSGTPAPASPSSTAT